MGGIKNMKKILLSIATLALVGTVVAGATGAFFSDTETSTGNTFTAGSIDLKVDSTSHYNGFVCVANTGDDSDVNPYVWESEDSDYVLDPNDYPQEGTACDGTWTETDLETGVHKFFNFGDLKPGDWGEDTISLHVYDNDAWGRFVMSNTVDSDNECTEPEIEAEATCENDAPVTEDVDDGELDDVMEMNVWLDQGSMPGFQNGNDGTPDPEEGDNIWQSATEPEVSITGVPDDGIPGVVYDLWGTFADAYANPDNNCTVEDGDTDYGSCHGLALDGRMVGSTTYYFGVEWNIPGATGNEVQSDKLESDFSFEVVQHRNNPNQAF